MDEEIFLVDELENRLVIEALRYKEYFESFWTEQKFDPEYFSQFLTVTCLAEYVEAIYERIRPLNAHEINRYLTFSLNQFSTHTPENRVEAIERKYWREYWFPNEVTGTLSDWDKKYVGHFLKHYTKHFHLFKEATEKAIADFKAGFLGAPPVHVQTPALQVQHDKMKTSLTVPQLAYLFKLLSELKPDIFDAKSKAEIHRFISANFTTKGTDGKDISVDKLRQLFNEPDPDAAVWWQKHFYTLIAEAKKFH